MRSATTVITILTIATSLVSCQKDKTSTLASTAITPTTAIKTTEAGIPPVRTGGIAYMMSTTQPGAGDVIKWNSGNMNVYTVSFEGSVQVGNNMERRSFVTGVGENRVLYTPFQLNTVNVPFETYTAPIFKVSLNPYSTNSLYLTGTAVRHMSVGVDAGKFKTYAAVQPVRVQLQISEPINLTTTYTPTIKIDFGNYGARLFFDPGKLLRRISPEMIDNADVYQDVIYISQHDNKPLYDLIMQNMPTTLSVDFSQAFSPSPI